MLGFFRTREWILVRRGILVGIILILGYRSYGETVLSWFRPPNPQQDIVITRAEFRQDVEGTRPAWIVGFRNNSSRFTYDNIQVEATYMDASGTVLEVDTLNVQQKLAPGEEAIIGSIDFRSRGAATQGSLKVLGAERVN